MKTIVILLDSLNRHMLSVYNKKTWVRTPNIDRLAQKSVICEGHWLGSAPCIPARRDIFTGRLNFLERNWGPIEPYDITLIEKLRENNIFTHMITDHHHYFEIGGENYCSLFDTYDFQRGQEYDPWVSKVKPPEMPKEFYGVVSRQYELNRSRFEQEEDYPGPRVFQSACEWLKDNHEAEDFFLMVEAFDPHEPFDSPDEYLLGYNDDYTGPRYDWPSYNPVKITEPPEALEHLRKCYAANMTLIDRWIGKFLDVMDKYNLWEDTLLIFTTDHGHLLGEHGFQAKGHMHMYNELAHLPLIVHLPGSECAGQRVGGITQNIDLMPTILDYFNIGIPEQVKGRPLRNVLRGGEEERDSAIYGIHGATVNVTDGKYTYFRAPATEENTPLYNYTAMPTTLKHYMGRSVQLTWAGGGKSKTRDVVAGIETGRFLKYTDYPVFRIPSPMLEGWKLSEFLKDNELYDIEADYLQENKLNDEEIERKLLNKLVKAMNEAEAPEEQFIRLGLKKTEKSN